MAEKLKSDGERWLEIMGYEHLANQPTGHQRDGQEVLVRDFNILCDSHVRPMFTALERMPRTHPSFPAYREAARAAFTAHFGGSIAPTN